MGKVISYAFGSRGEAERVLQMCIDMGCKEEHMKARGWVVGSLAVRLDLEECSHECCGKIMMDVCDKAGGRMNK